MTKDALKLIEAALAEEERVRDELDAAAERTDDRLVEAADSGVDMLSIARIVANETGASRSVDSLVRIRARLHKRVQRCRGRIVHEDSGRSLVVAGSRPTLSRQGGRDGTKEDGATSRRGRVGRRRRGSRRTRRTRRWPQ